MNKIDLLSQLENVKNNWILGLAAAGMLHRSDAPQLLKGGVAEFDGLKWEVRIAIFIWWIMG